MSEFVDVEINEQWTLKLPPHRKQFWERGLWEAERLYDMRLFTRRSGERVLYIGAEEGDMPALLASWGAEVFLVEPGRRVWANMKAVWEANNLAAPRGCYVGFCGQENTDHWSNGYTSDWPPNADGDIIKDHAFPWLKAPCDQPIVTVDTLCDKFMQPTMISIDVEGAEWDVIRGAEKTLAEHKPRIYLSLHPEFLMDQYGIYGREVRDMILKHGYTERLLSYEHECHFVYDPLELS